MKEILMTWGPNKGGHNEGPSIDKPQVKPVGQKPKKQVSEKIKYRKDYDKMRTFIQRIVDGELELDCVISEIAKNVLKDIEADEELIVDAKNTLILTVGLPRSGKSTWSRKQNIPMVNPDSIRWALYGEPFIKDRETEVWDITHLMVESLFIAGHKKVILDATSLTSYSRRAWNSDNWEVEYKVFDTSKEECIRRAIEGGKDYLVPVIEKMAANQEEI